MSLESWWRRLALAALLAPLLAAAPPVAPPAQTAPACAGRVERPTKIVIDCQPGFATGQDQIEVYRRAPAADGASWEQALSYDDAVWVYKRGADAALIIDFSSAGGTVTAKLYDDQSGDGRVAHQVNGDEVLISESPNPTVTATAEGGWWLPDGKINYNLDLTIDGSLAATVETLYLDLIKNDGKTDYTIHVRDPDRDGHPDYEWRQVYPGLSEDDGFYHTTVMANTADDELPTQDSLFWPFVGSGEYGVVKNYRRSPPPLKIDWQRARFELVSEFVASRTSPSNFFIYSIIRIENGKLNDTNFESPFAFYSLGGPNQDKGFPDLTVRTVYYPAGNVRKDVPIQQIDWTWRHNDSGALAGPNWDYRIGLFGRNEFVGQVDFEEFSVKITPYEQLPAWVVGNRWDFASFVARERPEYLTTEHIYEWSTLEGVVIDYDLPVTSTDRVVKESIAALPDYVRGEHAQDISKFYRKIGVGLRGEFTPRLDAQPYVYISPVDAKLHLLGAAQGVWTLDPRTTITVANRDGDGYLDEWRYQRLPGPGEPLTVTRQLNIGPGLMLYGDDGQVVLRRAAVAPSSYETLPPITNAEWAALGAELDKAAGGLLAPDDLLGMARRFPGQEQTIDGARLRGYRALPGGGFRFVLELDAGYATRGGALLGLAGLAPGAYVVSYDGAFAVEPLTPAAVAGRLAVGEYRQLEQGMVSVRLANTGGEDGPPARLELWASQGGLGETLVASQTVELLAGAPLTVTLPWAPARGGDWILIPRLLAPAGMAVDLPPALASVAAQPAPPAGTILQTTVNRAFALRLAGMALGFMALAGAICWLGWRISPRRNL